MSRIGLLLALLLSAPAAAQEIATAERFGPSEPSAEELRSRATALYLEPGRHREAARLHQREAALRTLDDPQAVRALMMSGRLFWYAREVGEARRAMESAAERALALGDIVAAAEAYADAAYLAQRQSRRGRAIDLVARAVRLAGSPLLDAAQRSRIRNRVKLEPARRTATR